MIQNHLPDPTKLLTRHVTKRIRWMPSINFSVDGFAIGQRVAVTIIRQAVVAYNFVDFSLRLLLRLRE
jgi:hypothetical protein